MAVSKINSLEKAPKIFGSFPADFLGTVPSTEPRAAWAQVLTPQLRRHVTLSNVTSPSDGFLICQAGIIMVLISHSYLGLNQLTDVKLSK